MINTNSFSVFCGLLIFETIIERSMYYNALNKAFISSLHVSPCAADDIQLRLVPC